MVSCLSPYPHPRSFQIPLPSCSKYAQVENYSIRLPGASSSRPSCHPRRGTSARWVSPRRTRWPPADTWRWPPSPAQGQPRPNFSCTNIGFVGRECVWWFLSPTGASVIQWEYLSWLQTISWGTWVLLWSPWPRWFSLVPDLERSPAASLSENQMTK